MLSGAGVLVRSLLSLQRIDIGFDAERILTARLNLPPLDYQADAKAVGFVQQVEERVRALPGVVSAGTMGWTPVVNGGGTWSILIDGQAGKDIASAPSADPQQVTPGYFKTLGLSIVRGRAFTEQDREDAPPVAIINEAMAKQLWPGQDPLGHTLKMFNPTAPPCSKLGCAAGECEPLELALVESQAESRRWREQVERYHYLGCRVPWCATSAWWPDKDQPCRARSNISPICSVG